MCQTFLQNQLTRIQSLLSWLKSLQLVQPWIIQLRHPFCHNDRSPKPPLASTDSLCSLDDAAGFSTPLLLKQHIHLREIIREIHRNLDIDELCRIITPNLIHFFRADWGFLLTKGHHGWQPMTISCHQLGIEHLTSLNRYLTSDFIADQLYQSSPIVVNTTSVSPTLSGSWLLIPIDVPQQSSPQNIPWGLVAIGHQGEMTWTQEQQQHARLLTDEIEVAVEHSLLYKALQQDNHHLKSLALTDSLTSLANRRQFDSYFTTEWHRLAREKQPLTLILCDIDYFKLYNDDYGHPTGDICLTQVSRVLTRCTRRPADLVARYGGEEFAVVLPNTDTPGGHNVAFKIRQQLAAENIPHKTSKVSEAVTLTMGIATIIPNHHRSSHDLLQAADLALYHAKQQGRDRIYVHALYCVNSDEITQEQVQPYSEFDCNHTKEQS
ncbi:MAG: diguanylate cyclase [Cyanobacteria bacterium P01_D01_bin.156]